METDLTRPVSGSEKVRLLNFPRVSISWVAYQKLMCYIDLYDKEIAGLGFVDVLPSGDLHITDLFLVEQSGNTGAHVDITDGAHKLLAEMAERDESPERIRVWWHSHVNMPAMWSDIDDRHASNFGGNFLISIVGNKRGDIRVRVDMRVPAFKLDDVPLRITFDRDPAIREACAEDIKRLVKEPFGARFFGGGKEFAATPKVSISPAPAPVPSATSGGGSGGSSGVSKGGWGLLERFLGGRVAGDDPPPSPGSVLVRTVEPAAGVPAALPPGVVIVEPKPPGDDESGGGKKT